jgi:FkbM family methyltransferase
VFVEDRDRLTHVLQGSIEGALSRRRFAFESVRKDLVNGVLVWGCGNLGRFLVDALRKLDIPIVAFVDRNAALWSAPWCGAPVLSPDALCEGAFAECVVIIGVFTSGPVRTLMKAWKRPHLTFPELAWGYPAELLPYCDLADPAAACEDADAVLDTLSLWTDEASRSEYVRQLHWRFTLDYDSLLEHLPASDTYFPPGYIALREHEHFVDCGAFDGDSIREFLKRTDGRFARITAIEADADSYRRLCEYVATLPPESGKKIHCREQIIGAENGWASFNALGTVTSAVGAQGTPVAMTTLDYISDESPITYVKMDIEGFEPSAIAGGKRAIAVDRPVLAISAYHAFDHLWTIPRAIHAIVPDYDLHLGRHSDECWELICYGVPPERRKSRIADPS